MLFQWNFTSIKDYYVNSNLGFFFQKGYKFFLKIFFFPTVQPSFFPACYRKQNIYFVWPYQTAKPIFLFFYSLILLHSSNLIKHYYLPLSENRCRNCWSRRFIRNQRHDFSQAICWETGLRRRPQRLHLLPSLGRWRESETI